MTTNDVIPYEPGELVESGPQKALAEPLVITPRFVELQTQSLAVLQGMLKTTLKEGRDFGRVPGMPGKMLFDSGTQFITNCFNCHFAHRRILNFTDDGQKISVLLEVPLLNARGVEVASGIGAASTLEVKYKYRWVENPLEWGYDEESMKTLKKDEDGNSTKYQIPNPEHDDLVNTILRMASKRAERDAVNGLPGVAPALKELMEVKTKAGEDWNSFWGEVKRLGLKEDELTAIIGTKSLRDWQKLDKGNSLERALGLCRHYIENKGKAAPSKEQTDKDKADLFGDRAKEQSSSSAPATNGPSVPPPPAEVVAQADSSFSTPAPAEAQAAAPGKLPLPEGVTDRNTLNDALEPHRLTLQDVQAYAMGQKKALKTPAEIWALAQEMPKWKA